METIKKSILNNFETFFYTALLTGISLSLLIFRMKITQSFFLLFLVWNLFLAWIPYIISSFLVSREKNSIVMGFVGIGTWLLFLPNAPYIVTDLIHLQRSSDEVFWFDFLLIGSFAIGGIYAYLLTIQQMQQFLRKHISEKRTAALLITTHFLSGFGIYLGRFLRWNSWDIIQAPQTLFYDILEIIIDPIDHKAAWMTTLGFGIGLLLVDALFRRKKNYSLPATKSSK